jgi:predicted nucleic acid-binding protein
VTVYADPSAIVKLYADEVDHDVVRSISGPPVVSVIARIEVHSALWRKNRLGELTDDDVAVLSDEFESDWWGVDERDGAFIAVAATDAVLDLAVELAARHGLRAYDAVQLASAISARAAESSITTFACFDAELRAAAMREGFSLTPRRRS